MGEKGDVGRGGGVQQNGKALAEDGMSTIGQCPPLE